jgi:hypothetical protein
VDETDHRLAIVACSGFASGIRMDDDVTSPTLQKALRMPSVYGLDVKSIFA